MKRAQTLGQNRKGKMEEDRQFREAESVAGIEYACGFGVAGLQSICN